VVGGEEPLLELLRLLKTADYQFITPTPATHARVLARPRSGRPTLRDIFGWNQPFEATDLPADMFDRLQSAGAVEVLGDGCLRSRLRVSSLGDDLFLHSSFPTQAPDSIFFGPDSYRFAAFIEKEVRRIGACEWLVDMGSGTGAGAIAAARCGKIASITLVDVNPEALRLAGINAAAAELAVEVCMADRVPDGADLVIANPPYLMDSAKRAYRDGGDLLGGEVALRWVEQSLAGMAPGGTMLLYTGAAVVGGRAPLLEAIAEACEQAGASLRSEIIDVDVFGEELESPAYAEVERIEVLGAVISTRG
jgi:methylase of polypeptide subunit release factors